MIDFADALGLKQIAVAGYDWGGRAAAIAAALHPERVRAAVFMGGYLIQNIFTGQQPAPPEVERELWYQWYFNTERGRAGLAANRRSLCKLLWQTWSPGWHFSDDEYNGHCAILRYSRFRGPGDPLLSPSQRKRARRAALSRSGPAACAASEDHVAIDSLIWRNRCAGSSIARVTPAKRAVFPSLIARRVIPGAGISFRAKSPTRFVRADRVAPALRPGLISRPNRPAWRRQTQD